MTKREKCTHVSSTSLYLTICWDRSCQVWSVEWSASGRVDATSGARVLWEPLREERLTVETTPDEVLAWATRLFMTAQELEEDAVDTLILREYLR